MRRQNLGSAELWLSRSSQPRARGRLMATEAVGQDGAFEQGVELVLHRLRQIGTRGGFGLLEEAGGVLLYQSVRSGPFRAVALAVDRGDIWRPLGLLADGSHTRLPRW